MSMQIFTHSGFGELRAAVESDETWFVAADVCRALDIANPTDAIKRLDDDEKARLNLGLPGGDTNVITFPGLLSLVLGSRKPEAREYKRWVTHEVLPSIHRTGGYMASVADETPEETMARALLMADDTIKRQRAKLAAAEPKAALCDAVLMPSKDCCTVSEAARYLANIMPEVRRQDVFDKLRATGMMCKRGTAPTRAGIDTGRMVAVASEYRDPESGEMRAGHQRGKLTMKGVGFLTQVLAGEVA